VRGEVRLLGNGDIIHCAATENSPARCRSGKAIVKNAHGDIGASEGRVKDR